MESKSIIQFKEDLVKILPFFPNNKQTKEELLSQSIRSVMFHYIHWALRFIPQRKRKIIIDPSLTADSRWKSLKPQIESLLQKSRDGEDLTPYLSRLVRRKGYTPRERIVNGDADRWDDKDMLLNTMGFHHLHLNETEKDEPSNEMLFIRLTRDELTALAIFDHRVFDSTFENNGELNAERTRLWKIYDAYTTRGMAPGTVYLSNPITCSGHPIHVHNICNQYTYILNEIDPKITSKEYLHDIYEEKDVPIPKKNKLRWCMNDLDFGFIDKANNFFVLRYGPV